MPLSEPAEDNKPNLTSSSAGHSHIHDHSRRGTPRKRLTLALLLSATYLIAEVVGGYLTGSLALLADAGHMLADVSALGLALFASWVAEKPAGPRWTYGRRRAEVLAALVQGVALLVAAVLIVSEAFERLGRSDPTPIAGAGVLLIAAGGLLINLLALAILRTDRRENLNVRGAWLHVMSDALGSVGAMLAGAAILWLDWLWADAVASILISILILFSAWHLLRDVVDVLMEAAPRHLDVAEIGRALGDVEGVSAVHDLHVWTVGSQQVALSCHLVVPEDGGCTPLLSRVYALLGRDFGISHATVQVEPEDFAHESPESYCSHERT